MKDWGQFAKTIQDTAHSSGARPSPWEYLIIKMTDNFLAISVFILTILFAVAGLFLFENTQGEKINWCLHAAELCLGVFLGLLKKS